MSSQMAMFSFGGQKKTVTWSSKGKNLYIQWHSTAWVYGDSVSHLLPELHQQPSDSALPARRSAL